jgi:hydrogenase/urease accessory protein HupE
MGAIIYIIRSRRFAEFTRLFFGLSVSLFLLVSLTFQACAHDPGLSSAKVTIGDEQIDVLLGFAQKDAESMIAAQADQPGADKPRGFAVKPEKLESIAANEFSLSWREQRLIPNQTTTLRTDAQNVEISLRFQRPNAAQVRLISSLIKRLPLGHREYLSVETTSGANLGEAMLSAEEDSFQIDLPAIGLSAGASNKSHAFLAFMRLGVEHILTGYDHLLFLFALMIVCRDLRSIFMVITCFTVAHSITLALATLDIVRLPGRIVEPTIAATIAYVGIENLVHGDSPKWRGLITFLFGLVHGLGFADALREFGIGSRGVGIVLPLVGFNLGVEAGQLSVAAIVLPILWQLRKNSRLVRQWVPVCSVAVALAGSYWMIERMMQS